MARISKTERILNLISFLLKSPAPVSWAEIKAQVLGYDDHADEAALERRFERDKEFLRTLGVPLQYANLDRFRSAGYFIEKADYYLPRIKIAPEDVAIVDLLSRVPRRDVGPLGDALRSALQKIQIDFPCPFSIRAEAEERGIRSRHSDADEAPPPDNLDLLFRATLESKRLRFRYHTIERDTTSEREIEPHGMGFTRGAWYVVGRCLARKDIRVFKVSRIQGEVTIVSGDRPGPDFQIPADFRLDDHLGKPPWRIHRGDPIEVKVRFDSAIAWMVVAAIGANDAFLVSADGAGTVVMRVTAVEPFLRWVLSFAQHAEVVAPNRIRERLRDTVGGIVEMYRR